MSDETHKRRPFQFSLRSLLLAMLLFSILVGWVGPKVIQWGREAWEAAEREKLRRLLDDPVEPPEPEFPKTKTLKSPATEP